MPRERHWPWIPRGARLYRCEPTAPLRAAPLPGDPDPAVSAEGPLHAAIPNPTGRPGRRVFASTTSVVIANAVVALLGTIALHQMTHALGASSYGEFVTVLNLVSVAMLFADMGVNTFSGREIARDRTKAAEVLGQNLGLRLATSVVIVPLTIVVGLGIYSGSSSALRLGIVTVALALPFEAFRAVSLSYYVATIQNYKTAVINVVNQLFYVGGVVVALHLGTGLNGCYVAYLIAMALTGLTAYVAVCRSVPFRPRLATGSWGRILRQSMSIGSIQIVNVLYLRTNVLMLSLLSSSHTVAQYGVAAMIVTFLLVVPNAYMTSMIPVLVASSEDRLTSTVNTAADYMATVGVIAVVGTACLGATVIQVLAGNQFRGAVPILSVLSLSVLFTSITSVFTYSSFARDHHHRLLAVSAIGLAANIGLDAVFIPIIHGQGAAVATVIVEAFILLGTYAIFRSRVGRHFTEFARILRILLAGGLTATLGWWRLGFGVVHTLSDFLLWLVILPVAYFLIAWVLRAVPPAMQGPAGIRRALGALTGRAQPPVAGGD